MLVRRDVTVHRHLAHLNGDELLVSRRLDRVGRGERLTHIVLQMRS